MDEDPSRPQLRLRLWHGRFSAVCLRCRISQPVPTGATLCFLSLTLWWSWGIVTPLILWADRQIPVSSKQLARRVLAHFLPSLLVTSVYVYLLGALRAALGIGEWNGLPSIQVSCRCAAGHVSLELAHLLADSGSLAGVSLLRSLYCQLSCVWSVWKKTSPRLV